MKAWEKKFDYLAIPAKLLAEPYRGEPVLNKEQVAECVQRELDELREKVGGLKVYGKDGNPSPSVSGRDILKEWDGIPKNLYVRASDILILTESLKPVQPVDVKGVVERITVLRDELADVRRDTLGNGLAYDRLDEVLRILTESQGERVCGWTRDEHLPAWNSTCGNGDVILVDAMAHGCPTGQHCRCGGRIQEVT